VGDRDPIAELQRALRADPGGKALAALLVRVLASAGRGIDLYRQLEAWAAEGLPDADEVSEVELERAFEAAEPELAQMITPDSIAEQAAISADAAPEERSPLASSGAFATRTMAELLERQGDRRGAARIRAALGESAQAEEVTASSAQRAQASRSEAEPSDDHRVGERRPAAGDDAVIAVLERWLGNARRLQP
jgi:hypothetical protein